MRADQAITELVLEALQPVGIEASVRAWEATRDHRGQKTQALTLALEKARYEASTVGWVAVTNAFSVIGDRRVVTDTVATRNKFFGLKHR